jgi:hypothetical protein
MNACKNFSDGMAVKAGRDPMTITGMTITGRNKRVEDQLITREIFVRTRPIKNSLCVLFSEDADKGPTSNVLLNTDRLTLQFPV